MNRLRLSSVRAKLSKLRESLAGPVLCSHCFSDEGLRLVAASLGRVSQARCPHCQSRSGLKLRHSDLEPLLVEFFLSGSFVKTEFGGASALASNPHHYGQKDVQFPAWLEADAHLLEEKLRVGIFHYGPPLWRVGEIEPLVALRDPKTRKSAAEKVIASFPQRIFSADTNFYRIRKNLTAEEEQDVAQYDSPPQGRSAYGRLDSAGLVVLYGSESLEVCIHESRVTIPDECFVATLRPTRDLRLLDLTAETDDLPETPFQSIDLSMRYLFSAEAHSYELTRSIARAARRSGFDGLYYPSYFSLVRPAPHKSPNVAIFGRPIRHGVVCVDSINKARLKSVIYDVVMGPVFK